MLGLILRAQIVVPHYKNLSNITNYKLIVIYIGIFDSLKLMQTIMKEIL